MGRRKIVNLEQKIFVAVLRMNAKEGFSNISTKSMAKKLHVSEPVFFSHFLTKQGLLNATFDYAWKQIFPNFGIPTSLMESDFDKGFKIYQTKNDVILAKWPNEILFVHDFLNASHGDIAHADQTMKETMDMLKGFFAAADPQLSPYDLDILARHTLKLSLGYLVEIIRGNLVRSQRSDALYYTLRHNGYLALRQTNLSLYKGPEK
jgi:Transcriptional regulator